MVLPMELSDRQERDMLEGLAAMVPSETEESLRMEGRGLAEGLLACSPEQAESVIVDLEGRNLIEIDITRGGELDQRRDMPRAKFFWVRRLTHV
jgi:hypothetical protein